MKNIKYLLFGTTLSFIPQLSLAQCVASQDCETLGYTETSCSDGNGIKCPFGNKWACFKSDDEVCQKYGFTKTCSEGEIGVGSACNNKYTECTCDEGYVWSSSLQKCTCSIGAMYYSDGSCSNNYISNKQLLGIVIYEKTSTQNGWVMAHKPAATGIKWGSEVTTTNITDKSASASCSNTKKLANMGSIYIAANIANNYKVGGKTWCLPAYDILNKLNNKTNFNKFNNTVNTIQSVEGSNAATILGNVSAGSELVWSSTEYNVSLAWYFRANTQGTFYMGHDDYYKGSGWSIASVRPVFAF